MDSPTQTIRRLPAHLVKYIASFRLNDAEYILSIFNSFTLGIENDDQSTRDYKKNVQRYLSCLIYNLLDEKYALSDDTYELSPLDLMNIYEVAFVNYAGQHFTYVNILGHEKDMFSHLSDLLEQYTTLVENEEIMGNVSYYINLKDLKYISLLERCLIDKRADLLMFIYKHMYSPIMAFYLYIKHNHIDYRTEENSLANDEWLLYLLFQGVYQKELLSLAIGGLFVNDYIYVETHNLSKTIERHMVMPNPEVVEKIIGEFPMIRNELIPFYMKSRVEIDEENEIYGEEGPDEVYPYEYWTNYKNTFEERVFIDDRCPGIFHPHVITIPKNEFIGRLLEPAN